MNPGRNAVEGLDVTRYNSRAVSENSQDSQVKTLICGLCGTAYEPDDNFCRHCGVSLQDETQLPSIQDGMRLPAVRRTSLPAGVARGAAVVAAGTLAEVLVRRLVRGFFDRKPQTFRTPARRAKGKVVPQEDSLEEDTQLLSETFLLRRVRIRR